MDVAFFLIEIKEIKSPWPDLNQQPFGHCPSCLLVIGGFLALSKQSCLQPNALAIELHGDWIVNLMKWGLYLKLSF